MYRYDDHDHRLVRQRVAQFRDQVHRYLAGQLSEDQFRQLRLRNGLYLERHAHMLRIAIPYGLLSSRQVRMLAFIARHYDRGYGHFTTRQNIQFNWPKLQDVPDILEHLASVEMHAIQTSGNVIRNITTDHLAGIACDELEDPRPYCEILRQWSTLHPEFSWLPRKFKVAIVGATADRAATRLHDIGFRLINHRRDETGFQVLVGGGMGRTPVLGKVIREFLPKEHLLSYTEAILRTYNLLGRRDNLNKARIKILVNSLGIEEFQRLVEAEWSRIRDTSLRLHTEEIRRMQVYFASPAYSRRAAEDTSFAQWQLADSLFARWAQHNTHAHKVPGYRIVFISLKAPGVAPGDATDQQLETIADLADRYSFGSIRISHRQDLVLADVQQAELFKLWQQLKRANLATPNIDTLTDVICCPGLDYCSLANAGSIAIAHQINEQFKDLGEIYALGAITVNLSGCMNACGHHHVGNVGILGVEKNGEEWYQLTLGGCSGNAASLGERLGPALEKTQVAMGIRKILEVYLNHRRAGERFIDAYRRLGIAPFKEQVYADHSQSRRRQRSLAASA
ncbi:MAG: nitrite/sulfite reductase [Gammaproteobacteria bacterium]|jgi:sulfite reductase (NADPH) hemoprotein beta-component